MIEPEVFKPEMPEGLPRLITVWPGKLSRDACENIRHAFERWARGEAPILAFDEDVRIYQLIDGRWEGLGAPDETGRTNSLKEDKPKPFEPIPVRPEDVELGGCRCCKLQHERLGEDVRLLGIIASKNA